MSSQANHIELEKFLEGSNYDLSQSLTCIPVKTFVANQPLAKPRKTQRFQTDSQRQS